MGSVETRRRILLVDDVELNRVLVEAVLKGATYDVDCVADGSAALDALETNSYDLVLMDIEMPGLDGHETANVIRQRDRGDLRLAALSSRNSETARLRSAEVGMAAHIARPIAPHELLRQIETVFAGPVARTRPDCWQKELYEEWATRLGSERMLGFLARLLDQCRDLRQQLTDTHRDHDAIHRRAHDLASTGGTLGFTEVTTCCRALSAAEGDASAHLDLIEALDRAIARIDRFLFNNGAATAA